MGKMCPLFSGSKGNCTYIGAGGSGILIDVGVSCRRLTTELADKNIDINSIKAIFITHEHSDHINGLKTFCAKNNIPIFASNGTAEVLRKMFPTLSVTGFENEIKIDGITVTRFDTSHDCKFSSGYCVFLPDNTSCGICTDTGVLPDNAVKSLTGKNVVLIESNHDVTMLSKGPYPPELKMRILSDCGHLSNNDCATAVNAILNGGTRRFVLAHLSENNNLPTVAESATVSFLLDKGFLKDRDYTLYIAKPSDNDIIYF